MKKELFINSALISVACKKKKIIDIVQSNRENLSGILRDFKFIRVKKSRSRGLVVRATSKIGKVRKE